MSAAEMQTLAQVSAFKNWALGSIKILSLHLSQTEEGSAAAQALKRLHSLL